MHPTEYVTAVRELYQQHANASNAPFMKRYMKNQFEFFGIKKPERVLLSQQIMKQCGIPNAANLKEICQLCFQEEQRELQYFVKDVIEKIIKRLDDSFLFTFESLLLQKSWWDTVDFLAPKLAGNILKRFPNQIPNFPDRWIESDNIWLQRAAILFQLDYKDKTDAPLLFHYILRRADAKEFFVQKAAGWALREYAKRNPEAVLEFTHDHILPKLTVREALKRLNK